MGKRYLTGFLCGVIIFGMAKMAGATLIVDSAGQIVKDNRNTSNTEDDMVWIRDMAMFRSQTYSVQQANIASLGIIGGYTDWHMANGNEVTILFANPVEILTTLFLPTYSYMSTDGYLEVSRGRIDNAFVSAVYGPSHGMAYMQGSAHYYKAVVPIAGESDDYQMFNHGAWVTASTASSQVPEPSTSILLGTGILGFAGMKLIRKKKSNYLP